MRKAVRKIATLAILVLPMGLYGCSDSGNEAETLAFGDQITWESHVASDQEKALSNVVLVATIDKKSYEPKSKSVPVTLDVVGILELARKQNPTDQLPVFWQSFKEAMDGPPEEYELKGRAVRGLVIDADFEYKRQFLRSFILTKTISDDSASTSLEGVASYLSAYKNGVLYTVGSCSSEECDEPFLRSGEVAILVTKPLSLSGMSYERSEKKYSARDFGL